MPEPLSSSEQGDNLITDEIVERAAAACDNVRFHVDWDPKWDAMPDAYRDMRRQQMRVALEAVAGDIIEAFGASGRPPRSEHC